MHYEIADILLDVFQNSIEAGSSLIILDYREDNQWLKVFVSDNGSGMDPEFLKTVVDPFVTDGRKHRNRKVGLGLPFLKQTCESVGGDFDIDSRKGEGTSLYFSLDLSNIDCPSAGDLPSVFQQAMLFDRDYEFVVNRTLNGRKYTVTRSELSEALGGLFDAESIKLAGQFLESQEEDIKEEIDG